MIEAGTRILVNGIPFVVESCAGGKLGKYALIVSWQAEPTTDLRASMSALMDKISEYMYPFDRMTISRLVVEWFLDERIKTGIGINESMRVKNNPKPAEAQIRRLIALGHTMEEIVEVLAYALGDDFWIGVLGSSINTIAKPRVEGIDLYTKIKNSMIAIRHKDENRIHVPTEEDKSGVIITE